MKRFWKWTCGIIILLCGLGYYGYERVMDYAAEQITEQILPKEEAADLLKSPEVQQMMKEQTEQLEQAQKATPVPNQPSTAANTPSSTTSSTASSDAPATKMAAADSKQSTLAFHSREEAMKFMLSKFSMNELKDFAAMAGGGITPDEKAQVKEKLMSRLTHEEYQALKVFGLTELQKQK